MSNATTLRFSWQALGTPDYSQCASFVASLPPDIRQQLTKTAEEVLRRILFLMWKNAASNERRKPYAWPSQNYLGERAGRCTRTIRRAVEVLQQHGLCVVTRRRQCGEVYQSNLYTSGPRLLSLLYARCQRKFFNKIRPDKNVPLGPKEGTRSDRHGTLLSKNVTSGTDSASQNRLSLDGSSVREASPEVGKTGFAKIIGSILTSLQKSPEEKAAAAAAKARFEREYWAHVNPDIKAF